MATKTFTGVTSSSGYEVKLTVDYDPASTAKTQFVTMQMWLRKVGGNYKRYQHRWNITYYINNVEQASREQTLPNDTAQVGVVSAGTLNMKSGVWYKWGSSCRISVENDGKIYTFRVLGKCIDTIPRTCDLSGRIQFPSAKVVPATPKPKAATFDETTRKIQYDWDIASPCKYILIYRTMYTANNEVVKTGWIDIDDNNAPPYRKFYNVDRNTDAVREVVPDNVTRVVWKMRNFSNTGHSEDGKELTTEVPAAFTKVWVKLGGAWKKAIPWVKVEGTWKKVIKAYVKDNGVWKQTKS
jgi:hypothetical protein